MLILPLHQPLTRANFPLMTTVLVLLNALVFFALQSRDDGARMAAWQYYHESGLAEIEQPLYRRHLEETDRDALREVEQAAEPMRQLMLVEGASTDDAFVQRLRSGWLDSAVAERWRTMRTQYDALRAKIFTDRHALHAAEPAPASMLSSMFLHGGVDHLLGNMLFLSVLGLLVEGALGAWRYLLLYLVGGLGAGAAWLAVPHAATDSVIGASGAIAALMGAFCVLWGKRRVRVFYWFFVVFDYARAPALALLPLWLGWELLQMLMSDGSRVAYEAHAGGIVSGALLALAALKLGWVRADFFDDAEDGAASADPLPLALELLRRMELDKAEALFEQAEQAIPGRFDVRIARYRCARLAGHLQRAQKLARDVLACKDLDGVAVRAQLGVLQDCDRTRQPVDDAARFALAARLASIGEGDAAIATLDALPIERSDEALVQAWLVVGFRLRDAGDTARYRRVLTTLTTRYSQSAQAAKARVLLEDAGS